MRGGRLSVCMPALGALLLAVGIPSTWAGESVKLTLKQAADLLAKQAKTHEAEAERREQELRKARAEHGPFDDRTHPLRHALLQAAARAEADRDDRATLLALAKRSAKTTKASRTLEEWRALARDDSAPAPDYAAADEHARAAPAEAAASVAKLAAYLGKGMKDERLKARAYFTWIADNVSYDFDTIRAGGKYEQRPAFVLRRRLAECGGYVMLFDALCRAGGLQSKKVPGATRQLDVDPTFAAGTKPGPNGTFFGQHAWNAVRVGGRWYFIDLALATGRGMTNGKLSVARPTDDTWFLVPPEQMISTHLPDSSTLQLLDRPMMKKDEAALPYLHPAAYRFGIRPCVPEGPVLRIDTSVTLSIRCPRDQVLMGRLHQNHHPLPVPCVLIQADPKEPEADVHIAVPRAGSYVLRLYARKKDDPKGMLYSINEYRIEAKAGRSPGAPVPVFGELFVQKGAYLYGPLEGSLSAGKAQMFRVKIPGALKVGVTVGKKVVPLTETNGIWSGEVTPARGEVFLVAEFPERRNYYSSVAAYKAE